MRKVNVSTIISPDELAKRLQNFHTSAAAYNRILKLDATKIVQVEEVATSPRGVMRNKLQTVASVTEDVVTVSVSRPR